MHRVERVEGPVVNLAQVFNTNPIEINLKFRINDRGEIVLVQSQSLDYDPMDILFRKTNYKEDMYE